MGLFSQTPGVRSGPQERPALRAVGEPETHGTGNAASGRTKKLAVRKGRILCSYKQEKRDRISREMEKPGSDRLL
jgi:hypothetical protein